MKENVDKELLFKTISQNILSDLERACIKGDIIKIEEIIEEIEKSSEILAKELEILASNFEYGKILKLLKKF